jgi:hypothetical protein
LKILYSILFLIGVIAGGYYTYINSKPEYRRLALTIFIVAIIVGLINSYNQIADYKKNELIENINASTGKIGNIEGAKSPIVKFGGTYLTLTNYIFQIPWYGEKMQLYEIDNKLYVSVIIRDKDGEPIAVIDKKTWTLYKKDYEYNNDDKGFELVTKGDRKVYFQINLKDSVVGLNGFLLNDKGCGGYFFGSNTNNDGMMVKINGSVVETIKKSTIPTLFKYPREIYYAQRNK